MLSNTLCDLRPYLGTIRRNGRRISHYSDHKLIWPRFKTAVKQKKKKKRVKSAARHIVRFRDKVRLKRPYNII